MPSSAKDFFRRPLVQAFAVLALYMTLRMIVYSIVQKHDFMDWVKRDTIMDGPRLVCLVLALYWGRRHFGDERFGWVRKQSLAGWGFFFISLIALAAESDFLLAFALPLDVFQLLVFSSLIVGFFEEILFRGFIMQALRQVFSPRMALLLTSLAFTVFHIQAQPVINWPNIFLIGLTYGALRLSGVSLLQLGLMHGIYDSLDFLKAPHDFGISQAITSGLLNAVMASLALLWLSRPRPRT